MEHSKAFLEDEIGKMQGELERVHTSVAALREKNDTMKAESDKLTAVVKAGAGWTVDQKLRLKELEETRDDLRAQLEGKQTALSALRRDIGALQEHIDRGARLYALLVVHQLPSLRCYPASARANRMQCLRSACSAGVMMRMLLYVWPHLLVRSI
jgi:hypothetical protein